jgi:hypothetical protein
LRHTEIESHNYRAFLHFQDFDDAVRSHHTLLSNIHSFIDLAENCCVKISLKQYKHYIKRVGFARLENSHIPGQKWLFSPVCPEDE